MTNKIQKLIIFSLALLATACNSNTGIKRKNIVELTPKLSVNSSEEVIVPKDSMANFFNAKGNVEIKTYSASKSSMIADPTIACGVAYTSDKKGNISAFDLKELKIIWTKNIARNDSNNLLGGGILYNENKLYVTNGTRFLTVLDAKNGDELLRKEFADVIRIKPVLVKDQIVLLQTITNQLAAYDIEQARFIWEHDGIFEPLSLSKYISPIVYDNKVIVNYSSGEVFVLDVNTGEPLWTVNLSSINNVGLPNFEAATSACQPIVFDNELFIAGGVGKLTKLSLENGSVLWQIDAFDVHSMSLIGNNLFIVNNARQIAAISPKDGSVKWAAGLFAEKQTAGKSKPAMFLAPFVSMDGSLLSINVVANNGEIYSFKLDSTGQLARAPHILKTLKNIGYMMHKPCCKKIYLSTNRQLGIIDLGQ